MNQIYRGIDALNGADALVGIPEGDDRKSELLERASLLKLTKSGKVTKRAAKLLQAAQGQISNAELLFIFTNGSPLRGQPPRVVIEAAIEDEPTKTTIAKEIAAASTSALDNDFEAMMQHLDRAGQIGASASKRWFTDPRNGWEPNKPSTIRAKGSDRPGIDTGQMRRAITHVTVGPHASTEGSSTSSSSGGAVETASRTFRETVGEELEQGAEETAEIAGAI
jgi:hypothetical protein